MSDVRSVRLHFREWPLFVSRLPSSTAVLCGVNARSHFRVYCARTPLISSTILSWFCRSDSPLDSTLFSRNLFDTLFTHRYKYNRSVYVSFTATNLFDSLFISYNNLLLSLLSRWDYLNLKNNNYGTQIRTQEPF